MSTVADICVLGAGPVGLAFAAALRQRAPRLSTIILDRGDARGDDGKTVAFGPRARALLAGLDAWPRRERPIVRAEICFPPFRPLRLGDDDAPPIARVAAHEEIRAALLAQVRERLHRPAAAVDFRDADDRVEVTLRDAPPLRAKLLVVACAMPAAPAAARTREFDYGQCAIALRGRADGAGWDGHTAFEYFTPRGIVTLAPRPPEAADNGNAKNADETDGTVGTNGTGKTGGTDETGGGELGIVVCAGAATGAEWNGLSDEALSARLSECFVGRGFAVAAAGARRVYAPQLRRVVPPGRGRIVRIGQGATIVHPIGAQGLNLALRDADALARLLAARPERLNAPAAGGLAADFARARARDRGQIVAATHALALLARSRRGLPLRVAGGLFCALAAADRAAPWRARALRLAAANY